MRTRVKFDGGMGEFPINNYRIESSNEELKIIIDPQVINCPGCIITLSGMNITEYKDNDILDIVIKANQPFITVIVRLYEAYYALEYTFYGIFENIYKSGKAIYNCSNYQEDHWPELPF